MATPEEPTDASFDDIPKANTEIAPIQTNQSVVIGAEIDPEVLLKKAEANIEVQKKLRLLALKATNNGDWVNQNGKPYLQWSGASKIAGIFGVSYENIQYVPTHMKDEKGEYMIIECIGEVKFQGRSLPETGTGTTRDPFFALRKDKQTGEKYFLPLSEVDITNIKKKALTNFLNRGLKSMCGLSFTWDEVRQVTGGTVSENTTTGVAYNGSKASTPSNGAQIEAGSSKERLWTMLEEMHGSQASVALQALTTWKDEKTGKVVKGKSKIEWVSDKQANFKLQEVKTAYDEWKKARAEKNKIKDDFSGK